jgi:hypothetical protein
LGLTAELSTGTATLASLDIITTQDPTRGRVSFCCGHLATNDILTNEFQGLILLHIVTVSLMPVFPESHRLTLLFTADRVITVPLRRTFVSWNPVALL